MKRDILSHLLHDANSNVLNVLEGTSSHSDLSELFHKILVGLDDVKTFTPADRPFAHYFAYVGSTVFGFCESMCFVTFLLPQDMHADAISVGGEPNKSFANGSWVNFPAFGTRAELDHAFWAKQAYLNALK
jgi:hypothetical protein